MAELVLNDMDDAVLKNLQSRAQEHGRTPADEAKAILKAALRQPAENVNWGDVDAIYDRLSAAGGRYSDSADLLREDRDR